MTQTGTPESTGTGTPSSRSSTIDNISSLVTDLIGSVQEEIASPISSLSTLFESTSMSNANAEGNAADAPAPAPANAPAPAANANAANGIGTTAPPGVPPPVILSNTQLAQILQLARSNNTINHPNIDNPRYGGVNSKGAWTGAGDPSDSTEPMDYLCYRQFVPGVGAREPFKAVSDIESKCKLGLSKHPSGLLFSGPEEKGADQFVACFRALRQEFRLLGFDGIFVVVLSSGSKIDLFENPGGLNEDMIKTWYKDLTTDGVVELNGTSTPTGQRLPVCSFDRKNLSLSGQACLNSCTEGLKQDLYSKIAETDRNGLYVLFYLIQHIYRPCASKVDDLRSSLKALDITKYPGENISLFNVDAIKIIKEVELNFVSKSQVPNLTRDALTGLTHSSVDYIKNRVIQKQLAVDELIPGGNTNAGEDPIDVLNAFEKDYKSLMRIDAYPPAAQPKQPKAFQAQAETIKEDHLIVNGRAYVCAPTDSQPQSGQLVQVRSATSTHGNGGNGGNQGGKKCFKCGSDQHLASDPNCPKKDGPTHGLSDEVNKLCSEKIKEALSSLPPRANIPDDAEHTIVVNGAVVAKYCRHCGRYVKGRNAHFTSGHTGRMRFSYKPPSKDDAADAPAPAPAGSANFAGLSTLPEGIDPNSIPVVDSLPGSSGSRVSFADQVPVPAGFAPVQFDPADYALQPSLNLAAALDAEDKTDWTFLSMLGLNM